MKVWGLALAALLAMALPILAQDVPTPDQQHPGWWLPEAASDYSWQVDRLYIWIFWVVIGMFVLTEGLLIVFCVMYRRRAGHRPTYTHGSNKAEITWTVIPALMLLTIAVIQIPAWNHIKKRDWAALRADPNSLNVDVLGQQFKWNIRYPGTGKQFNVKDDYTGLSNVHMPFGKTAVFTLRSADVIHSVFIPHMRVKQDTVPGLRQSLWFKPNRFKLIDLKAPLKKEGKKFDGSAREAHQEVWASDEKDFLPGGQYYTKKIAVSAISTYDVKDGFYNVQTPPGGQPKKVKVLHQGTVAKGEWADCDYALGVFEIACAELCGAEHHTMRGFLIVEPKASYDDWLKSEMEDEPEPPLIWKAWRQ